MSEQALNVLKLALLGLIYLFFARVLWAVWSEVRAPRARQVVHPGQQHANPRDAAHASTAAQPRPQQARPAPPRKPKKGRKGRAGRLVVLEPRHRRGMAIALGAGEITLGRDANCTISITDDGYVSQLHLRIYDYDGQPMVEDLGSTNGTFHNGNKLIGSRVLSVGDRIQVGTTVIERSESHGGSGMAELKWGAGTDPGRVRAENEDNLFVGDGLFVVADGMGGHEAGEVASRIAIDRIRTALSDDTSNVSVAENNAKPGSSGPDADTTARAATEVVDAVRSANMQIFQTAVANPSQAGMGTTITAIAVIEDPLAGRGEPNIDDNDPFERDPHGKPRVTPVTPKHQPEALALANVGDSRTYLYRHGRLRRVTIDHNYVSELVEAGHITDDEARYHPRRNIITRALGIEPDVTVDWWTLPLVKGDRFLLCSDGLVDEITDTEIAAVLKANADPQTAVDVLIELANEAGGRDNVTVVVVDVLDGDDPPEPTQELDITPNWADDDTEPTPRDLLGDVDGYVPADEGELAVVPLASLSRKERRARKKQAKAQAKRGDAEAATTPTIDDTANGDAASTAPDPASSDSASAPSTPSTDHAPAPRSKQRRRWWWLLAVLVIALVAGGVAGGAWARRGFYVDFDGSGDSATVTVFQGRRGGVLWIEPTEAASAGVTRAELADDSVAAILEHPRFDSLEAAVEFVRSIAPDDPPDTSDTSDLDPAQPEPEAGSNGDDEP